MAGEPGYRLEGDTAWIVLERNGVMTLSMLRRLRSAIEEAGRDDRVNFIVVRGQGRFFSVGADLKHVADAERPEDAMLLFKELAAVFKALLDSPKITVIAYNGDAYGGGSELLWAADLAVAVKDARLHWPEAKWGLIPPALSTIGVALLGPARAVGTALTNGYLTAKELHHNGLITLLAETVEELDDAVRSLISQVKKSSPEAARSIIAHARASKRALMPQLDAALESLARLAATSTARSAAAAFKERREPEYTW